MLVRQLLKDRADGDRPNHVAAAASHRLRASSHPSLRRVVCDYDRGVLVLRGQLPSFYQKQLAQAAVASLEGVTQIVNEIEVSLPAM